MPDKKTYTDYKRRFGEEKYDRIYVTVEKGQKEIIKAHAEKNGESLNGFINRVVMEAVGKGGL